MAALQIALDLAAVTASDPPPQDPVEFAWRVHTALDSWTGKVDTKASIALAIEGAALGFVVSLSDKGRRFANLHGAPLRWFDIGLILLLTSMLSAALVVMPQLRRRKSRREWRTNMIYFGHLRHWDPDALAHALQTNPQTEHQLSRQLVTMSQVAWRKHARLQWSIVLLVLAAVCLVLAAVTA